MLEKTISIAAEAGEIIKKGFESNVSIEFKTDEANIVTNIDKEAEKIITNFIKKEYPTHSIVAEESGVIKNSSDYTWYIDPIDGTTNFAHKLPIFAVSIGLKKGDEIIFGVINDVMQNSIFVAERGAGAFQNGKKISVSQNRILSHSVLVTGFGYDRDDKYKNAIEIFGSFLNSTRTVRRLGSAAIDLCYVASGIFDGFWEENLNSWDVCAGIILVEEAGGAVTDYYNDKVTSFPNTILASNGVIHSEMLKIIQSDSKVR